jgi:hypothetical protein
MSEDRWTYADLGPDDVERVAETERTLDADVVVVYRAGGGPSADVEHDTSGLRPAALDDEQLERLHDLEEDVDGVAVAYRRSDTPRGAAAG